ncbi:uncharacterized protein LOC129581058 isoform X2 [Paramacrobiotus metropolitanus]|nr:uncharacterized protein LOC129581058 isoform X2 [Paramacrobiotus metropolitanus]
MNVLFEKNWTTLVNERIIQYQKELLAMLLNDTLPLKNASSSASMPNSNNNLVITPNYTSIQHGDYAASGARVKDSLRSKLYAYEAEIFKEVRQHGYDGDATDASMQWSIPGGLLYSLTVITTIGYGHIAPKTVWGKLITMLYAIMGIPLMLLCLANIGDALAHAFKFFYWKICCLYCEIKKRRKRLMRIQSVRMSRKSNRSPVASMVNNVGLHSMHSSFKTKPPSVITKPPSVIIPEKPTELLLPNTHNSTLIKISSTPENRSLDDKSPSSPDASATTTEVATTSVNNDPAATERDAMISTNGSDNNNNQLSNNPSVVVREVPIAVADDTDIIIDQQDDGMTISLPRAGDRKMSVCNMPPESIDGIDYVDESPQPSPTHLSPDETTAVIVHDVVDDDDQMGGDFEPRYEKQSVPVYVCLLVVFGYIVGGAILFGFWEGWEPLDGAYFCFITLTTIGFGDFVPGVSSSGRNVNSNSEEKLTLCSLYLVFGMALLAMSFNLVQEAATEKAKWIARKIGILSDDSEEED